MLVGRRDNDSISEPGNSHGVDARFEVLGNTFSLLSASISPSQNLYTRKGTLLGFNGKPENVRDGSARRRRERHSNKRDRLCPHSPSSSLSGAPSSASPSYTSEPPRRHHTMLSLAQNLPSAHSW